MSETKSSQRFHSLNAEQVEVLHQVLSEVVPIHGRGNFPTLELRPRDIIIAVRARLQKQGIAVRDVRLNGSTASHVLVRDNGTSYKDLDIIFGVELPSQEEFQVIKESVLGCLLDWLPVRVNRERISNATMKEAYVQKMVKVFNEHDRWSLISLSNNSGKNLELKFVSALRRQFEFSVDSFQIILDRLLESYMQQDSQRRNNMVGLKEQPAETQGKDSPSVSKQATAPETERSTGRDTSSTEEAHISQTQQRDTAQAEHSNQTTLPKVEDDNKEKTQAKLNEDFEGKEDVEETDSSDQTPSNPSSEIKQSCEETETPAQIELRHDPELPDETTCSTEVEESEQTQPCESQQTAHSNRNELSNIQKEPSNRRKPLAGDLTEQTEQSELAETSNNTETESLNPADESHADETYCSECFDKDQRSKGNDQTKPASAPDTVTDPLAEEDAELADEETLEKKTGEQTEAESKNDSEPNGEAILAPDAKHVENTHSIDCSCSLSSISLTFHNTQPNGTQDTLEIYGTAHTENSEKSPDVLDANSSPDTQDISPAPPGLVSDKKTSSSPSSKASDRLAHMVVLKHSSPKPPRRMCRKVTPSPVPEGEPAVPPIPDPNPCFSPEPEISVNPEKTAPSPEPPTTTTTDDAIKTNPEAEPNPAANPDSNPTPAPDPAPDTVSSSARDPVFLPQELSPSQPIEEASCETSDHSLNETPTTHFDEQIQSSPTEAVPAPNPLDSEDAATGSQTDVSGSNAQEPEHTSDVDVSDEDESGERETKTTDLHQPNSSPQETTLTSPSPTHLVNPPIACVTPPLLSLSPPCFHPSPPSLSPPPCLSPPPHCLSSPSLSAVNLATSFSSPALSFSPTSSCLSSPPYLTPPMLSLSPPPLCLTPPSPCLSPPLLCLTPPVESEHIVAQVSSDMESLILNTDSEEPIKEPSPQPQDSLLQLEDEKDQHSISPLPQVAESASFPITIPSSNAHALPRSQSEGPGEPAPPTSDEASSSVPAYKEAPEVPADMPEQNSVPWASGSVPAVEVLAESMYGDFEAAMDHLRYRLIATRNPEEIRGGGLLKYSNLLVRDYRPASETQIKTLERYMCSRFFIDFPDVQEQQRKILSYLKNHFIGEERSKYQYLMTLRRVVDDSTVCLMGHERRQTLNMITVLALKVLGEQNIIPNTDHVTCFYQPAPYLAEHSAPYLAEPSYCSYYIPQGGSTLLYQPYPLHLHTQTGLV